jgi:hypothetical protein
VAIASHLPPLRASSFFLDDTGSSLGLDATRLGAPKKPFAGDDWLCYRKLA